MAQSTGVTSNGSDQSSGKETVGLVLAGGGARGAYELGALSVLLPELHERGHDVAVLVGTSVGALNVAWLAANARLPVQERISKGEELWRSFRLTDVLAPVVSIGGLGSLIGYSLRVVTGRGRRPASVLDPRPLADTLATHVKPKKLNANVADGTLGAVAVAASSGLTGGSVVFHSGGPEVPRDLQRGIDYVPCELGLEHILASAAIPALFPARKITAPTVAAGYYVDGGTRLNTPIKPALKLGAQRVVVVGLHATWAAASDRLAGPEPLDVFEGAGQLFQALLADPLAQDVQNLAKRNELVGRRGRADPSAGHDERQRGPADTRADELVPFVFVAPDEPFVIGQLAQQVFDEHYDGLRRALNRRDPAGLGRLVCARDTPAHGELLSYLFFAPEFADALIRQGEADAQAWIDSKHDDGIWQRARLSAAAGAPRQPIAGSTVPAG
jgi:NTE family protein